MRQPIFIILLLILPPAHSKILCNRGNNSKRKFLLRLYRNLGSFSVSFLQSAVTEVDPDGNLFLERWITIIWGFIGLTYKTNHGWRPHLLSQPSYSREFRRGGSLFLKYSSKVFVNVCFCHQSAGKNKLYLSPFRSIFHILNLT